jgi:hypothetical protein
MPSHVPRTDTTKKREQLARRNQELQHAIRAGLSREQVLSAAEAVKAANLSLLKAELHWAEEARLKGGDVHERTQNLQEESRKWMDKTSDEIANEVSTAYQIAGADA